MLRKSILFVAFVLVGANIGAAQAIPADTRTNASPKSTPTSALIHSCVVTTDGGQQPFLSCRDVICDLRSEGEHQPLNCGDVSRFQDDGVSQSDGAPRDAPACSLSPENALRVYQERALRQLATLTEYSDETTIYAEVPAMSKSGQLWLKQTFFAPQSMAYTAVKFVGDGFIKSNVITRLLQSDVKRVQTGIGPKLAIRESNYRISYKGIEDLNGRPMYAFALKPRRKDPGLFKGKILVDPRTGHVVRALGSLSKSPSLWIKRVDFIQDYVDVGDFTMPAQLQSVAEARIAGRVVVSIRHLAYQVRSIQRDHFWSQQSGHEPATYTAEPSLGIVFRFWTKTWSPAAALPEASC